MQESGWEGGRGTQGTAGAERCGWCMSARGGKCRGEGGSPPDGWLAHRCHQTYERSGATGEERMGEVAWKGASCACALVAGAQATINDSPNPGPPCPCLCRTHVVLCEDCSLPVGARLEVEVHVKVGLGVHICECVSE